MAGNDPWLNWGWLKVGPFTPTEEERVAADRRLQELKAQEKVAAQGGIHSLLPPRKSVAEKHRPPTLTPEQKAAAQQAQPQQMPVDQGNPQLSQPWPEKARDWSFGQGLVAPFIPGGSEAWRKAREAEATGLDETTPMQTVVPNQGIVDAAAANNAGTGNLATAAGAGAIGAQPVQEVPVTPTVSPQQQAIEDIKRQKAMIDAIYPQRPVDDTAANAADAYALAERDRAKALAQLAFFSGVTQGAGGTWEGVGRGLAAAGNAHADGFARYQKALMGKAERASDRMNQQYDDQVNRTDAAVKLYAQEQTLEKDRQSEGRLAIKERRDSIDDYFKERLKIAGGNDFAPPDQSLVEDIMRDWRISRERGEIIQTRNAKDAPSS